MGGVRCHLDVRELFEQSFFLLRLSAPRGRCGVWPGAAPLRFLVCRALGLRLVALGWPGFGVRRWARRRWIFPHWAVGCRCCCLALGLGQQQVVVVLPVVPQVRDVLVRRVQVHCHVSVGALVCVDAVVHSAPVEHHSLVSHQREGDDGRVPAPVCVASQIGRFL